MEYLLSKHDRNRYYILDRYGNQAAYLIRRTEYEGKKATHSWMLLSNGKVLRHQPFRDREVALSWFEDHFEKA